jgi:hypothetical protein
MKWKMLVGVLAAMVWSYNCYAGCCGGGGGGFSKRPEKSHVPKEALSILQLDKAKETAKESKKPIAFVVARTESSKDDDFGKVVRSTLKKLERDTVIIYVNPANKEKIPGVIKDEIKKSELNIVLCDPDLSKSFASFNFSEGDKKRDFIKEFKKKEKEALKELANGEKEKAKEVK